MPLVGHPLAGDDASGDGQCTQEGELGEPEPLGEHGGHGRRAAIRRLVPRDHEVETAAPDGSSEGRGGLQGIRSGQAVVDEVDAVVRAHGERLADRVLRVRRSHGYDGDLAAGVRLLHEECRLDRFLVDLIDHDFAVAVDALRGRVDAPVAPGVGDLLHEHGDLHHSLRSIVDNSHQA